MIEPERTVSPVPSSVVRWLLFVLPVMLRLKAPARVSLAPPLRLFVKSWKPATEPKLFENVRLFVPLMIVARPWVLPIVTGLAIALAPERSMPACSVPPLKAKVGVVEPSAPTLPRISVP